MDTKVTKRNQSTAAITNMSSLLSILTPTLICDALSL